jgi:hypothetical protein
VRLHTAQPGVFALRDDHLRPFTVTSQKQKRLSVERGRSAKRPRMTLL